MIPFTCPHCGLFTEVEEQYAGLSGACYGCGKTISVPPLDAYSRARYVASGSAGAGVAVTATGATVASAAKSAGKGQSAAVVITVVVAAVLLFLCVGGLGVWFLTPAVGIGRGLVAKGQCRDNLIRIGQALRQYEMEYGVLPPAYLADANGKPMHSWRVLILPYLGHKELYERYNFAEPWDGPSNLPLSGEMPPVFGCPGDPDSMLIGETSYLVVEGPGTMFPGRSSRRSSDASDGDWATILVVESHATSVPWTQPSDLVMHKMAFDINSGADREIGGNHESGAHVLMVDGEVRFLGSEAPVEAIEAMLTAQGGESVVGDYLNE